MSWHHNIEIRMANHEEAASIARLIFDAFAEQKDHYTAGAFEVTTPGVAQVEERIQNRTVWVALLDDVIVGTASATGKNDCLFIRSVAVHPEFRRHGIGSRLMMHMEKLAVERDKRWMKLTTAAFLLPACRLYLSLGFMRDGNLDLHGTQLVKLKKIVNPFSFKIKLQKHDKAK